MGIFMKIISTLFHHHKSAKAERDKLDKRISRLEKATLNGDEKWMLELVKRRDRSCVLKVIEECEENGKFKKSA
jgi:hypothetical protein